MRKWIVIAALALGARSFGQASGPAIVPPPPSEAEQEARARMISDLRAELDELLARRADARARAAEDQTLVTEVRSLDAEVARRRQQLAAVEAAASTRELRVDLAVAELVAASRQLASGDTADVEARLAAAEKSLGRLARADLDEARAALRNDDLANASLMISQALYHARLER